MAPRTEIKTIMFLDLVNYTRTTQQLRRDEFDRLHDVFDSLTLPKFEHYHGTMVKKIGDAFLVTFNSATDAVLCAVDLQRSFAQYNREKKIKQPLSLRIALHAGEIITKNKDVYGDAVNIAARLEQLTKPHHIVLSETVFSAMNKNEIPLIHLGVKKLKGVRYPLRLFRVRGNYDTGSFAGVGKKIVRKTMRVGWNLALVLMLIVIIGLVLFFVFRYLGIL